MLSNTEIDQSYVGVTHLLQSLVSIHDTNDFGTVFLKCITKQ